MGDAGGFFRGTSTEQDARFSDKYKKYVAGRKFPPEFDLKVDLKKVAMDAIKPWVASRITQLLGFEDEVLIGFAFGLLDDKESLNPKELQLNLDGFLEADSPQFVGDLWKLLLSAQASPGGIPAEFLEQKKAQLRQKREEESRVKSDLSAVISRDKERLLQEIEQRRAQPPPPVPAPAVAAGGGYSTKTALPYGLFVPDAKQPILPQTDLANAASSAPLSAAVNHDGRSEEGSRRRDRDADSDRDRRRTDRRSRERGHRDRSADRDRDRRRDRDRDRDRERDRGRRSRRERRSRSRSRSRSRGRRRDGSRERERVRDGATDSGGRERGDRRQSRDQKQQQRDERARRSGSEERTKRKRDESTGTADRPDDRRRDTSTTTTTGGGGASSPTPAKRTRPDDGVGSPVDRRQQEQQEEASDPHLLESTLREQAMHSLLHRSRDRSDE